MRDPTQGRRATTPTRTLSKKINFRYCNNPAINPSRSEWKVLINIAGIKSVGINVVVAWEELIKNISSGSHVLYTTLKLDPVHTYPDIF